MDENLLVACRTTGGVSKRALLLTPVLGVALGLMGLAPALVLEMLQGASGPRLGAVALTFAAVQAVEGLYLTPVWVGRASKLHPLEVLLALVAFGHWFGLLGLLFAVPLMVTVKVVFRVLLEDYRQHPWFTEADGQL